MPADLPGFYFDEQKNRYFPLSFKPAKNVIHRTQAASESIKTEYATPAPGTNQTTRHLKRKRESTLWNTTDVTRSTHLSQKRLQATQFVSISRSSLQDTYFL